MNLSLCLPHLLHTFSSESDLVKAIDEISEKFTTNRDKIGDYLKDPRLVSAYTAFYLTTNIPKLEAIMNWLPEDFKKEILACDLIDLGAGPGTFSLAWMELNPAGKVVQIETSELMKKQALKLWQGLYPGKELVQNPTSYSGKKFVLFGHSANEMGVEKVLSYLEKIQPDHILFIEPGTKDFFSKMLSIRSELIARKFEVIYPCPTNLACPMAGSEDWCHQFLHLTQAGDVERLTQMAKKDRRNLPIIVHAYSRSLKQEQVHERIVRVFPETKFSLEWEVCSDNILKHYQVMKRP